MEYLKQTGLIQQRLTQYAAKTNSATSNFQDMTAVSFTNLQHSPLVQTYCRQFQEHLEILQTLLCQALW